MNMLKTLKDKIPGKVTMTVIGAAAAATFYLVALRPYLEQRKMKEFEKEAKAIYELRTRQKMEPLKEKDDFTYK